MIRRLLVLTGLMLPPWTMAGVVVQSNGPQNFQSGSGGDSGDFDLNTDYVSPFTFEVINIKPAGTGSPAALSSDNRIFFAYPGLEYNIQVGVRGGSYPYQYELINEPAGMTVSTTGEISWPNPTADAADIEIVVRDTRGVEVSSEWSIDVVDAASTRFRFVDSEYVGTESGSISQPWNTLMEAVNGTNDGQILYFRGRDTAYTVVTQDCGSGYDGSDGPNTGGDPNDGGTLYVSIDVCSAAYTWLAYPGDPKPKIDLEGTKSIRSARLYLDGFEVYDGRDWLFHFHSNVSYNTFRRNLFHDVNASSDSNRNQGTTFARNEGIGYYLFMHGNESYDYHGGHGFGELYNTRRLLFEANYTHGPSSNTSQTFATPVSLKENVVDFVVRGNTFTLDSGQQAQSVFNEFGSMGGEISFNKILRTNSTTALEFIDNAQTGVYVYRNTISGNVTSDVSYSSSFFQYNLVEGTVGTLTGFTNDNNITTTFGGSLFNASGDLEAANEALYLCSYGAQVCGL
jgi:hypothetical protein